MLRLNGVRSSLYRHLMQANSGCPRHADKWTGAVGVSRVEVIAGDMDSPSGPVLSDDQLCQILSARKSFLRKADFSKVVYKKRPLEFSIVPNSFISSVLGANVIPLEQLEQLGGAGDLDVDFSTRLQNTVLPLATPSHVTADDVTTVTDISDTLTGAAAGGGKKSKTNEKIIKVKKKKMRKKRVAAGSDLSGPADRQEEVVAARDCHLEELQEPDCRLLEDNTWTEEFDEDTAVTGKVVERSGDTAEVRAGSGRVGVRAKGPPADRVMSLNVGQNEMEQKIQNFNVDLKSYVDVCIHAGLLSNARTAIVFCHLSNKSKKIVHRHCRVRDVTIYNRVMHAFAKQARLDVLNDMFEFMKDAGVKPNLQSFAACLECLARHKTMDLNLVENVIQDLTNAGHDLYDLFRVCTFHTGEERALVHRAILAVRPEYKPNPRTVSRKYENLLLAELNREQKVPESNPYSGVVANDVISANLDRQLEIESSNYASVDSIVGPQRSYKYDTIYTGGMRDRLDLWQASCRLVLRKAFDRNRQFLKMRSDDQAVMSLFPYLRVLEPAEYVDLMMEEINNLASDSLNYSPSLSFLWKRIGTNVLNKYIIQDKIRNKHLKKLTRLYHIYLDMYNGPEMTEATHRVMWEQAELRRPDGPDLDVEPKQWPLNVVRGVGKFLYDIILYETKIEAGKDEEDNNKVLPAFYTIYRNYGSHQKKEVKPHPSLVRMYHNAAISELHFDVSELPMLVPPIPWTSIRFGGNLLSATKLIRIPDQSHHQWTVMSATPVTTLHPVLDSLNTLSACAWRINKPILDIIINVFNNKGDVLLDIPPPVSECPPLPEFRSTMSREERSAVIRSRLRLKQRRAEMYSLWCNEHYRLSIANKFRDEVFWFPHNLDFRGRVYPTPPHFNHLGSDVVRSILLFAKGKPLGPDGLDWLKIHVINLTGTKKRCSNQERLRYANEVMDDIIDSADHPMTGRKWWQKSDEPWQTLSCCVELRNALSSGNPAQYTCHYPVHQDGSFNGLQHYAALGRDQAGAESVNLNPRAVPSDVYSDVAEMVEVQRRIDAEGGMKVAQVLEGFVRRKVIKQTVMTTVYGVTKYGAKYQILRQLKALSTFPAEYAWPASFYLTEKTFHCLREMFTATKEIQDMLVLYAQTILKVRKQPIEWRTPLGLPVVQPYHKSVIRTRYGNVAEERNASEKPNAIKQKNAFPPNYIHSLDSTHMMMTSLYCLRASITYVSVHDCYWTHACDVNVMNAICRQQFVSLHSQPILENLAAFLAERYGYRHLDVVKADSPENLLNLVLAKVPKRGTFDLNNVLESTYFFS